MRIKDVSVQLVEVQAARFSFRQGAAGGEKPAVEGVVRVHTDDGVFGQARIRQGIFLREYVDRWIRDDFVGHDPLDREVLWRRLWELDRRAEMPSQVLGAVDTALWDLAGKIAGLPVYKLLGAARQSIAAHASTATYATLQEYLDVADQCLERGFDGIKVHGWGDVRRDAELCLALRGHVGDNVPLMYDGSAAFDLPDAVYLGGALAEAGYTWYEEPLLEHSITSYEWLAERVSVPLLVAEVSRGSHRNSADFLMSGCASYVRASWFFKGGVTGAMRIAHLAEAFGVRAEVHGGPSGGLAARHLCLAIPNTTSYECVVWGNPIVVESAVRGDGTVTVPEAPGLGWEEEADSTQ